MLPLPLLLTTALTAATTGVTALHPPTLLTPWQITRLSTHSPSGYPSTHPYSRLAFTISDPNTIVLGTTHFGSAGFAPTSANCTVWWLAHDSEPDPREGGWVNTCGESEATAGGGGLVVQGKWTFEVVEGSGGGGGVTTDFGVRVRLEEAVTLSKGSVVKLRFEGEAAFRVGGNMAGSCGGSGVCNWGLKKEDVPVLVKQELVEMVCVVGTCEDEDEE
ncbi:hypothetical protein B0I37DRAFT_408946 [Chaetomium sp. MPI-CAGE-AT-0009]|nr:hypothetical protein B0I37DRAFT_408946 [Chaetomium sp. MPI-CAGE-AT-0009]